MYIETSSPRRLGDKARLASPVVTSTNLKCLRFWYHMYGTHINALNVNLTYVGGGSSGVWSRSGTRSNQWYQAQVDIMGNSTYKIVFEGVRGTSFRGDIAIDDITVRDGSCQGQV